MLVFIVLFQFVDPRVHPEHYCPGCGEHPIHHQEQVPEEHWMTVSVAHPDREAAMRQYLGLMQLISEGELIRDAQFHSAGHDVVDGQRHDGAQPPHPGHHSRQQELGDHN